METYNLKKIISILDFITLAALGLTFLVGIPNFFLKSQLTNRQDKENEKQKLEIAQSNQRSKEAIAAAEEFKLKQQEAELKTKEVELELERLRTSVRKTDEKVNKTEKMVTPRNIDPDKLGSILKRQLGVTVALSAIGDPEAQRLASILERAFAISGWTIIERTGVSNRMIIGNTGVIREEGVIISSSNDELLTFLKTSLETFGIKVNIGQSFNHNVDIDIHVAAKPMSK